ncbi:MAG TPA: hypothetical protein VNI84_15065 [Pyrinomonadaceae bacterium]|nr:hypothetical protein [Pyrinomonadaceae bacterium]
MKVKSIFSQTNRKFLVQLFGIFLIAFFIRGVVIWQTHPIEIERDEFEYTALAKLLVKEKKYVTSELIPWQGQGGKTGDPTAFRSPVLPAFLAGHFLVFGENLLYPRITLIFLSSLICILLGYIGFRLGGEKVGLLSAAIWAIYPPCIFSYYTADRILTESIGTFFLVASFAFIISFYRNLKIWTIILAGLFMGLAILTRGYLLFILPLCVLFFLLYKKYKSLKVIIFFSLTASLVIGGWVLRNMIVMGKPVLSTQTEHFYLGNNLWARGSFNGDIFIAGWDTPQYKAVLEKYPNAPEMSEIERSEMWKEATLSSIKENPKHFLWLLPRKTAIFWLPMQSWEFGFYRYHYLFALLLLFSFIGFWLKRKDDVLPLMVLLSLPMLGIYISALLTYAFDRYRFPGETFIIILGVIGFFSMLEYFRKKKTV